MLELILNPCDRKHLTRKKQKIFDSTPLFCQTSSSFIIEERLDDVQDYVSLFQETARRNSTIEMVCYVANQSIIFRSELRNGLSVSDSTLSRTLTKVDAHLQKVQLKNLLFSFPKSKQEEICRRTILSLFLLIKTVDLVDNNQIGYDTFCTILHVTDTQKVSINSLPFSESDQWQKNPFTYLFYSESSYLHLWKCILGMEPLASSTHLVKKFKVFFHDHGITNLTSTEKMELERLYLFFLCLYPDQIPDQIILVICTNYLELSRNHRYLIDTYDIILSLLLFL